LAGLLHHLAGSAADVAMRDYMLSRIGTEPARERLLGLVMASLGLDDAAAPGFTDMVSLRPAFWNAFLAELSTQYGGWDGYVTQGLGFSEADLARIKRNLRS
jgi:protein tyrosine/serine phosphatase